MIAVGILVAVIDRDIVINIKKKPPLERAAWVNKQLLGVPIAVTSREGLPIKLHFGLGCFARYGELSNQTPLSLLLHHYPLQ